MFVRAHTIRKPNGKQYTYYRLVESYRDHGTVNQRILGELGRLTAEEAARLSRRFAQIAGLPSGEEDADLEINGIRYFGPPLLVETLLETLRLPQSIERVLKTRRLKFDVLTALKLMLCAHLFKGGSRAEWAVWEWQQKLFGHGDRLPDIEYLHFLRSVATLAGIKDKVETHLFSHLVDLFDLHVDLVFYDLTSTYVEGMAGWSDLLRFGYSRDKRKDCRQVVVGLVMTREGFPITVRVFEGNKLDHKTLKEMVQDLEKRFSIRRCVWVADAGLLTRENRELLETSGYEYILGAGSGSGKDIEEALNQVSVTGTSEDRDAGLTEVALADGRRVVVIESAGRREKNAAILERRLKKVREGFAGLCRQVEAGRAVTEKEICVKAEKVLHNSRVKKYFSYEAGPKSFKWTEDGGAVSARKANGGKYGLLTNTQLPKEDILETYRTLLLVEDAFRVLKNELNFRPLWHKCDINVEGHVLLAVWSLVLYRTLEKQLKRSGVELEVPRALNAVKEVCAVEVAQRNRPVWRMVKASPEAKQVFKALGVLDLKQTFGQWSRSATPYSYVRRCIRDEQRSE